MYNWVWYWLNKNQEENDEGEIMNLLTKNVNIQKNGFYSPNIFQSVSVAPIKSYGFTWIVRWKGVGRRYKPLDWVQMERKRHNKVSEQRYRCRDLAMTLFG